VAALSRVPEGNSIMAITGIMRPGFCQIRVLDMKAALRHYRDAVGLDVVSEEKDGRVYLRAYDEFDRHSIILRQSESAGLDFYAFKCVDDAALVHYEERLSKAGVEARRIDAGEQPGVGRQVAFNIPTGHEIRLFAEIHQSESCPQTENPEIWHDEPRGMRVMRFDHALLYGDDIEGVAKLFREVLDFGEAERVVTPDGKRIASFLSCGSKPHDIAFVHYPEKSKFHHVSFYLESWNDVGHAADLMVKHDINIDIGPTRHGITRGQTIYFFDPSGNRNEVFAGGYTYYPDTPIRTWAADQLGKAIFYYDRALNDAFLTVVT
jgi:catechol 2,3-dioxygenase